MTHGWELFGAGCAGAGVARFWVWLAEFRTRRHFERECQRERAEAMRRAEERLRKGTLV